MDSKCPTCSERYVDVCLDCGYKRKAQFYDEHWRIVMGTHRSGKSSLAKKIIQNHEKIWENRIILTDAAFNNTASEEEPEIRKIFQGLRH